MRYSEIVTEIEVMSGDWDGMEGQYDRYVDDAEPFAKIGGLTVKKAVDRKITALLFYDKKKVVGFVLLTDESEVMPNAVEIAITFKPDYQRKGLGWATYKFLLDHGYVIVSGYNQYPGAISIWKKLIADPSVKVFVTSPKDVNSHNPGHTLRKLRSPDEPWTTKNEYLRLVAAKK
jgi:hypothetical protein